MNTERLLHTIVTSDAPQAVGSYSQGVIRRIGDQREVFTSGQIAFDPNTGSLVDGGIVQQTERVLDNVGAILKAGGARPGDVYQTDVVLRDPELFPAFNGVYGKWEWVEGQDPMPTRFTSVGGLVIPKAVVEIRCFAVYPASRRDIFTAI